MSRLARAEKLAAKALVSFQAAADAFDNAADLQYQEAQAQDEKAATLQAQVNQAKLSAEVHRLDAGDNRSRADRVRSLFSLEDHA